MKNLDIFIKARISGKLISRDIVIAYGNFKPKKWWETYGKPMLPIGYAESARDDFRPLVGLDVILIAESYGDELAKIYEAIKAIARSVMLVVFAWGPEDILLWDKANGDRQL